MDFEKTSRKEILGKYNYAYFLALGLFGLLIVTSQILVQQMVSSQDTDAQLINRTGRQRF